MRESKIDKAFQEGFEEGIKEEQDLTIEDFARLSYLICEDFTLNHNDSGFLIYKLHHKIKQEKFKVDKK